ncbi:hypothetical protein KP509_24G024800 [Ceratopteris richardii]|uniref:Uncharacterized protein n=1 Tax=Ceratopteris richardii TaxID=49495 RepID=A0A8T2RTA9_CERRI|nr:hypothetical protein KP509_24G024800 [Ceratopteris richardii]
MAIMHKWSLGTGPFVMLGAFLAAAMAATYPVEKLFQSKAQKDSGKSQPK